MKSHSGLFWEQTPKKIKEKAQAPHPFWLEDGYVPPYKHEPFDILSDKELKANKGGELICDIELYPNYFLAAFLCLKTGKVVCIEEDMEKLNWILHNYKIITFNGNNFDVPIMALAIAGKSIEELKYAADMIIGGLQGWHIYKAFDVPKPTYEHVDIIEVAPLKASLKIYGGRLHAPRMQDLPFQPETALTPAQIEILKNYCVNDLITTAIVYSELEEQLKLREDMSATYRVDLRSKSDAQLAEAVFKVELKKIGVEAKRAHISPGTVCRYKAPAFLTFRSDAMKALVADIERARFMVTEKGSLFTPNELVDPACWKYTDSKKRKGRVVEIGKSSYRMGIGGLHSCEKNIAFKADEKFALKDKDVASYYPALILNQNLFPKHLGMGFLSVYRSLVNRRLIAKKEKNKKEADSLKISINGVFGKLNSVYSIFYSPELLLQTTITGQLSLLMLIELLEDKGVQVCSANTDGIVVRYPRTMQSTVDKVFADWEKQTNFETEETEYDAIYLANVNNYVAVKPNGQCKTKGAYSNPWGEKGMEIFRFHKNPTNSIVVEAVTEYLTKGTDIKTTIRACRDLTKFLSVRVVKGGAIKNDMYLGKAVRWYISRTSPGDIIYASNGNKVPESEGAQPCMQLPDEFPDDIDYVRYEMEAIKALKEIAAI